MVFIRFLVVSRLMMYAVVVVFIAMIKAALFVHEKAMMQDCSGIVVFGGIALNRLTDCLLPRFLHKTQQAE